MKTMTVPEFHAEMRAQRVVRSHVALVCPMCKTVQSLASLTRAMGPSSESDEVERYIGFSCIGRFTGAGPHRRGSPPGRGCDWTLGGLFRIHELEVVGDDGKHHMSFMPATPEQAKALMEEMEKAVSEPAAPEARGQEGGEG